MTQLTRRRPLLQKFLGGIWRDAMRGTKTDARKPAQPNRLANEGRANPRRFRKLVDRPKLLTFDHARKRIKQMRDT